MRIKNRLAGIIGLLTVTAGNWLVVPMASAEAFKPGIGSNLSNTETFSQKAGYNTQQADLSLIIGRVLKGMLGLLGTVFVVLVIYAGFLWMTAQGNEEQITKAKKMITGAVIGLAIVVMAYGITDYVLSALFTATVAPG